LTRSIAALEARPADAGIADAPPGREIEPYAAKAAAFRRRDRLGRVVSITATPRAVKPRALMPNSVAELSGP